MAVQKTPWTRVNAKVCCTCEYWDGERELQFLPGVRLNAIQDELSDVLRQPRSGILRDLQTVAQAAMKEV